RLLRIAAVALLSTGSAVVLSYVLSAIDRRAFAELLRAFGDLFGGGGAHWRSEDATADSLCFASATFVISAGAAWAGYKLERAGRIISVIQLVALSLLYQKLCWETLAASGHPVSMALSVVASCTGGYLLKRREDRRRVEESQYYELKLRNQELQESRLALV